MGHFAVLPCPHPLPAAASSTFGGCWVEAAGRRSQAQGLWVLHISQPGRLGALMKVQEGQDQPGWGGGETAAAHLLFHCPQLPGPPSLGPCLPAGGWGGWRWLAGGVGEALVTEETGDLTPCRSSGGAESCVLGWRGRAQSHGRMYPYLPRPVPIKD